MKWATVLLLISAVMVFNTFKGCNPFAEQIIEGKRIVDDIYWHEGKRFSAMVMQGNRMTFHKIPQHHNATFTLICDATDKPWYEYHFIRTEMAGVREGWLRIHIRSKNDLKTADWNHGKFGSGKTTKITQ